MAYKSYDRVDFYKQSRDYSGLFDDVGTVKPEKKEVNGNSKSVQQKIPERHGNFDRKEKLKALEQQKLKQRYSEIYGSKVGSYTQENGGQKRKLEQNSVDQQKRKIQRNDKFGSFFGPSEQVIAKRAIENTQSRLAAAHVARKDPSNKLEKSRTPTSNQSSEVRKTAVAGAKTVVRKPPVSNVKQDCKRTIIATEANKRKAQQLREARDYSSLLSNGKETSNEARKVVATRPDSRKPVQTVSKSSTQLKKPILLTRPITHGNDIKKAPLSKQPGTRPPSSASNAKSNVKASVNQNRQYSKSAPNTSQSAQQKRVIAPNVRNEKMTIIGEKRKAPSMVTAKSGKPQQQKPALSRPTNQQKTAPVRAAGNSLPSDRRKPNGATNNLPARPVPKMLPPKSSSGILPRASTTLPPKPAARPVLKTVPKPQTKPALTDSHRERPKKRPSAFDSDDEFEGGENYSSIIRKLFRYDPTKYRGMDEDDRCMEVGFSRIQAEERRSARIAREEDERELALIEAEEREERETAKRRKLGK